MNYQTESEALRSKVESSLGLPYGGTVVDASATVRPVVVQQPANVPSLLESTVQDIDLSGRRTLYLISAYADGVGDALTAITYTSSRGEVIALAAGNSALLLLALPFGLDFQGGRFHVDGTISGTLHFSVVSDGDGVLEPYNPD